MIKVTWKESKKVETWDIDRAVNHLAECTKISRPMIRTNLENGLPIESPFAIFKKED